MTKILAFAQCCKEIRTNKIIKHYCISLYLLVLLPLFIISLSVIPKIVRRRTNGCSPIGERSSSSQRTTVRQKKNCRFHPGSVRAADDGIPKDASLHNRQGLSRPLPLREDEGGCGSEEDDAGRKVGADIRRECSICSVSLWTGGRRKGKSKRNNLQSEKEQSLFGDHRFVHRIIYRRNFNSLVSEENYIPSCLH